MKDILLNLSAYEARRASDFFERNRDPGTDGEKGSTMFAQVVFTSRDVAYVQCVALTTEETVRVQEMFVAFMQERKKEVSP